MKFIRTIGAGVLVACASNNPATAANPPLDRPTPPPCCADGICYPKPDTWGVYGTRWRRWPGDELEPTPASRAPGKAVPDLEPYETLPPELEDRSAPPPTKPRAEAEGEGERPPERPIAPGPGGEMEAPRGTPLTTPPESPLTAPPESPLVPRPTTPFSPGPTSPFSPGTPTSPVPQGDRMPWENGGNEPTGDWDPPPAPPTATAAMPVNLERAPARRVPNRFTPAQPTRPVAPPRQSPGNDPPPILPVALASATL